ncbi:MAG: MerR family transcriptional regulator [Clostridium sp.]
MVVKFTVGEFAKLNNLKKQTLIYYDNIGLFKPNIIDENNGYRYYTSDQLELLDNILILREIGISIQDIKSFLDNRDSDKTLHLLKEQRLKLKTQAQTINKFIKKIDAKISTLEIIDSIDDNVSFIEMDKEYLATETVKSPNDFLQADIAIKKLFKNIDELGHYYTYQIGVIISKDSLLKGDFTKSQYVFLPLSKKENEVNTHTKEKGLYAVIYHKGTYDEVGTSYKKLLNKIDEYSFIPISGSYEYSILDSLTSRTKNDYITKIAIKVEKKL